MTRAARAGRRREAGFTLIELMVALLVSSLLVGMILAIFLRISVAYRGQQQVAEVQGKLAAARAKIEIDAKHAGLNMAPGFTIASSGTTLLSPLRVINNSDAPDEIGFYYADTMVQAATVTGAGTCTHTLCDQLDSTVGFAVGDLVVEATASAEASPFAAENDAKIAKFQACVLQISAIGPNQLTFSEAPPWGAAGNTHCGAPPAPGVTMFYKLAARYWRIDPARPGEGVLQMSPTGDLLGANDWQDQAYGFTDLQVATRFYDDDPIETPDPDLDPRRDWYSDDTQETWTEPGAGEMPIQVSISLVARTERDVEGIASSSTPNLTVPGNTANNTIGDRAAIPLPSALPELSGNRIFRYTTFQVDLRNLGVGR